MNFTSEVAEEYKFTRIKQIVVSSDRIQFIDISEDGYAENNPELCGNVYLLIIEKEGIKEVVYVGMTKNTIEDRIKQHLGGYHRKEGRGNDIASVLKKYHSAGYTLTLYYRNSERFKILTIEGISLCEAEEKALIQKFTQEGHPLLNNVSKKQIDCYADAIKIIR